jgi:hypothetical protein
VGNGQQQQIVVHMLVYYIERNVRVKNQWKKFTLVHGAKPPDFRQTPNFHSNLLGFSFF